MMPTRLHPCTTPPSPLSSLRSLLSNPRRRLCTSRVNRNHRPDEEKSDQYPSVPPTPPSPHLIPAAAPPSPSQVRAANQRTMELARATYAATYATQGEDSSLTTQKRLHRARHKCLGQTITIALKLGQNIPFECPWFGGYCCFGLNRCFPLLE